MQAVILAGGKGTRFGSVTKTIPKPMVRIGNKPIIWHILKLLSNRGISEFIICTGYKESIIRKYLSSLKEDWKINQGEYLDLTDIRCEIHWLQGSPHTKGLGSVQKRRLKLEWWHVLSNS